MEKPQSEDDTESLAKDNAPREAVAEAMYQMTQMLSKKLDRIIGLRTAVRSSQITTKKAMYPMSEATGMNNTSVHRGLVMNNDQSAGNHSRVISELGRPQTEEKKKNTNTVGYTVFEPPQI